jgi:two-component system, OmpR family, response regulator RegX3
MSESAWEILVVEDEESFVEALTIGLKREGFRVQIARTGTEALEKFRRTKPDLVLLDVMLPEMSGIDVCRAIRAESKVPIIMVTAKSSEIDTVVSLEVGADDYVTKPYRIRELVARMRAVLRRAPVETAEVPDDDAIIEIGDVRLDVASHELRVRDEVRPIPLKEFEVLQFLMENAGRVLTRDQFIDRVWGHDYVGDTKTLDVHIKRLRSRIEEDPANPTRISTVRGLGYRYERSK